MYLIRNEYRQLANISLENNYSLTSTVTPRSYVLSWSILNKKHPYYYYEILNRPFCMNVKFTIDRKTKLEHHSIDLTDFETDC